MSYQKRNEGGFSLWSDVGNRLNSLRLSFRLIYGLLEGYVLGFRQVSVGGLA